MSDQSHSRNAETNTLPSGADDSDDPSVVVENGVLSAAYDKSCDGSSSSKASDIVDTHGHGGTSGCSEALAGGISALVSGAIKEFDSKAEAASKSQDELSNCLGRLTKELDQILEDAPVPFIMQHAGRISGVRKRVSSLNLLLKSIQRRVDNIDQMLSRTSPDGHGKTSMTGSKLP